MLILQNHWGTTWGMKGFFLCPYDVWSKQNNIFCWYDEKVDVKTSRPRKTQPQKVEQPKADDEQKPREMVESAQGNEA